MATAILILLSLANLLLGFIGISVDGNSGVIVLNFFVAGVCAAGALLREGY